MPGANSTPISKTNFCYGKGLWGSLLLTEIVIQCCFHVFDSDAVGEELTLLYIRAVMNHGNDDSRGVEFIPTC